MCGRRDVRLVGLQVSLPRHLSLHFVLAAQNKITKRSRAIKCVNRTASQNFSCGSGNCCSSYSLRSLHTLRPTSHSLSTDGRRSIDAIDVVDALEPSYVVRRCVHGRLRSRTRVVARVCDELVCVLCLRSPKKSHSRMTTACKVRGALDDDGNAEQPPLCACEQLSD